MRGNFEIIVVFSCISNSFPHNDHIYISDIHLGCCSFKLFQILKKINYMTNTSKSVTFQSTKCLSISAQYNQFLPLLIVQVRGHIDVYNSIQCEMGLYHWSYITWHPSTICSCFRLKVNRKTNFLYICLRLLSENWLWQFIEWNAWDWLWKSTLRCNPFTAVSDISYIV